MNGTFSLGAHFLYKGMLKGVSNEQSAMSNQQ